MELLPGCGENLVLFFLLLAGCVVAETHGYGSSDPTLARPGHSGGETAGSRVVESSEWDCAILDEADDVHWSGGVYSCSREGARVVCHGSRNACRNWSFDYDVAVKQLLGQVTSAEISMDVAINVQLGGVQLYFVLIIVVYGKRLESCGKFYEGVFPDERCHVDDDGGTGSFVGHERCGGRGCLGGFTRKCFRDFWKERGLRDRLLDVRETENEDQISSPSARDAPQTVAHHLPTSHRWLKNELSVRVCVLTSREGSVFEAVKRYLVETACVDMASDGLNALEFGAALLLEGNQQIHYGIKSCAAVTIRSHRS